MTTYAWIYCHGRLLVARIINGKAVCPLCGYLSPVVW